MIAGSNGRRVPTRLTRIGTTRCGIGIERLPAFDLGLPSVSFPPTCVIDRRTRIRRAFRSLSSTLSDRPTA